MPGSRLGHATAVVSGQVYIFGGTIGGGGLPPYSNLWVYDPPTDTWDTSLQNMPLKWFTMGYSEMNDRVYMMAGSAVPYPHGDRLRRVEVYTPHNDLSALVEKVNVDRSYAAPGAGNVLITTKINNPIGITLFAEFVASGQTPVDSLQLFDDGNHGDGSAGDSLFANFWPVPAEESNYSIDLKVTRVDADTVVHILNNMALFTTIGPVVVHDFDIPIHDPTLGFRLKLNLRNDGLVATAKGIAAAVSTSDTNVTRILPTIQTFGDIAPGQIKSSASDYIFVTQNNVDSVQIAVSIHGEGILYWSDTILIDVVTGVADRNDSVPSEFALFQNYPNPFNPETTIQYQVPERSEVKLLIFNFLGQRVATLVDEVQSMGDYSVQWDGKDDTGKAVASGVYLYRLQTNQFVQVKKLALLR
jgi:hypothetical protein